SEQRPPHVELVLAETVAPERREHARVRRAHEEAQHPLRPLSNSHIGHVVLLSFNECRPKTAAWLRASLPSCPFIEMALPEVSEKIAATGVEILPPSAVRSA